MTNLLRRLPALFGLIALAFVTSADAQSAGTEDSGHTADPAMLTAFNLALTRARAGELDPNGALANMLADYPLAPYLSAARLRHRLATDPSQSLDRTIKRFVEAHPKLPPARQLRRKWLDSLLTRRRWQRLLAEADSETDSSRLRCGIVHARIEQDETPKDAALALWNVGYSQPDACDPVFAWLKQSGLLTTRVIKKRAEQAIVAGHDGLARYLNKKLDNGSHSHDQLTRWLQVTDAPARLGRFEQIPQPIAIAVFKRFARADLDQAAEALPTIVRRLTLDNHSRYRMRRFVALLYAQNHRVEALKWFDRISDARMANDEHAFGWAIRSTIYQQQWPRALERLNKLPERYAQQPKWRYWRARALAELGQQDKSEAIYRQLADKRAYYGFRAADHLDRNYNLNTQNVSLDAEARRGLSNDPSINRARLLYRADQTHRATREWVLALDNADQSSLAEAAVLAYRWGWYSRAIITLADSDHWDDLRVRYPVPYSDIIKPAAGSNDLSEALIRAVIRTESLFQTAIRSSANAVGLMQLLPSTARYVANSSGDDDLASAPLTDATINIQLGSRLLAKLRQRWNDNLVLAIASYNAGEGKVADWLPKEPRSADVWIANIPYTETRRYVKRVLKHTIVFEARSDNDPVRLVERLLKVTPHYRN